jgi:light-independent protochlorophyllide reductase subunit N
LTILNESGVPDVLSPLHAAKELSSLLPGALVIVVGTRTEAYLAQTLPEVRPHAPGPGAVSSASRLRFIVLDADEPPEQGQVASRVIEACAGTPGTSMALLVAGRAAKLMGVDAGFEARLAARRLEIPVKTADPDPDPNSRDCLSTDLEDGALAALVELCREATSDLVTANPASPKRGGLLGGLLGRNRDEDRETRRHPTVLLGILPNAAEDLTLELERAGVAVAGSVPGGVPSGAPAGDLPAIGEGTVVAPLGPHLVAACRRAEGRGAKVVRTLAPIGVDGTARFIQDVSAAAGMPASQIGRAREVWEGLEPLRNRVRGRRIFLAGDTGLELPLARFLADAGAVVLEVGAPRLDRRAMAAELHALGSDVDVVASPDREGQIRRIDEAKPDLVVCGPGLYVPLVARGHLCRTTLELRRAGLHGYAGARRVLELFARTFERAGALDALDL